MITSILADYDCECPECGARLLTIEQMDGRIDVICLKCSYKKLCPAEAHDDKATD